MFGGRRLVRIPIADKPPVRAQRAPPPNRSLSLLVGLGSRNASTTKPIPAALSPRETLTATHSVGRNRALMPIEIMDWFRGSTPTSESLHVVGGNDASWRLSRISREQILDAYKGGLEAVITLIEYLQEQFQNALDELSNANAKLAARIQGLEEKIN
jgi:hypothetical protein